MKKVFFALTLVGFIFSLSGNAHAQVKGFCTYPDGSVVQDVSTGDCDAYGGQWSPTDPNPTSTPGTIGSGTQGTNPINTNPGTTATGTSSNTSASELAQCSAIKFLSLLDILIWIKCIIVVAFIPLVFAAAFFFFLWGILRFMAAADSARKEAAKKYILWGLIGLFVMVSLWGIIAIVSNVLGLNSSVVPVLQTEYLKK